MRLGLDVRVVRGHRRVGVAERPAPDLRVNSGVTRQAGGRVTSLVQLDHRQPGQRRQPLEPASDTASGLCGAPSPWQKIKSLSCQDSPAISRALSCAVRCSLRMRVAPAVRLIIRRGRAAAADGIPHTSTCNRNDPRRAAPREATSMSVSGLLSAKAANSADISATRRHDEMTPFGHRAEVLGHSYADWEDDRTVKNGRQCSEELVIPRRQDYGLADITRPVAIGADVSNMKGSARVQLAREAETQPQRLRNRILASSRSICRHRRHFPLLVVSPFLVGWLCQWSDLRQAVPLLQQRAQVLPGRRGPRPLRQIDMGTVKRAAKFAGQQLFRLAMQQ